MKSLSLPAFLFGVLLVVSFLAAALIILDFPVAARADDTLGSDMMRKDQKSHLKVNGLMYMDMPKHRYYTAAQAKLRHYKSSTGQSLVRITFMPFGAKPADKQ